MSTEQQGLTAEKISEIVNECWSQDGSDFSYQTLGDLIDCCRDELEVGSVVYVGTAVAPDVSNFIDVDSLIERMGEAAYDEHHEHSLEWPQPSKEAKRELEDFLVQWANKHCPPTFYGVENERPYAITAEDLADD